MTTPTPGTLTVEGITGAPRTERVFGPCPKCANATTRVQYHSGKRHCAACWAIPSCKYSSVCDGQKGEHLTVRCERCGYGWLEDVS